MIARFVALLLVMGLLASPAYAQKMSGDSQNIDENGAADVKLKYLLACERLQDQASKGHCIIVDAANLSVISKTTAVTIGGGAAAIFGGHVNDGLRNQRVASPVQADVSTFNNFSGPVSVARPVGR